MISSENKKYYTPFIRFNTIQAQGVKKYELLSKPVRDGQQPGLLVFGLVDQLVFGNPRHHAAQAFADLFDVML